MHAILRCLLINSDVWILYIILGNGVLQLNLLQLMKHYQMMMDISYARRNDVWDLVSKPPHKNIIGTKWVFRNKLNEQGEVTGNKDRLVA